MADKPGTGGRQPGPGELREHAPEALPHAGQSVWPLSSPHAGTSARPYYLLWLALVIASVLPGPFVLGFYGDDWPVCVEAARHGAPFSAERFQRILAVDATRPATAPVRFVLSSLLGDRPMLWHIVSLGAGVLIVLLLGKIAALLNGAHYPRDKVPYWCVAISWLIIPWCVGFRLWPTLVPVQFLLIAFLLMSYGLFLRWTTEKTSVLLPGVVYLFICVGYEAFYFQFIPVLLIGVLLVMAGRAAKKDVLASGAGLLLAQGCAVGWYFFTKRPGLTQRRIASGWTDALLRNLDRLPPELLRSMQNVDGYFTYFAAVSLIACAVILYQGINRGGRKFPQPALFAFAVVLCCATGVLLSLVAFTMGGRPVFGIGVETRVFSIFTAWSILGAAVGGGYFWLQAKPAPKFMLGAVAAGMGVCLLIANLKRTEEWAAAWKDQQRILAETPVPLMTEVSPGATVLYVNPLGVNGAPIFASSWDINHAIPLTHPTVRLHFVVYSPWGGPMTWDGAALAYGVQPPLEKASRLYVWIPGSKSFYEAAAPFRVNQDLSIHELPVATAVGSN